MWEELARRGVITNKKETNIKKYLDALCERLYLNNQWKTKNSTHQTFGMNPRAEKKYWREWWTPTRNANARRRLRSYWTMTSTGRGWSSCYNEFVGRDALVAPPTNILLQLNHDLHLHCSVGGSIDFSAIHNSALVHWKQIHQNSTVQKQWQNLEANCRRIQCKYYNS